MVPLRLLPHERVERAMAMLEFATQELQVMGKLIKFQRLPRAPIMKQTGGPMKRKDQVLDRKRKHKGKPLTINE